MTYATHTIPTVIPILTTRTVFFFLQLFIFLSFFGNTGEHQFMNSNEDVLYLRANSGSRLWITQNMRF